MLHFINNHLVQFKSSACVSPDRNYPFINCSAPPGGTKPRISKLENLCTGVFSLYSLPVR